MGELAGEKNPFNQDCSLRKHVTKNKKGDNCTKRSSFFELMNLGKKEQVEKACIKSKR